MPLVSKSGLFSSKRSQYVQGMEKAEETLLDLRLSNFPEHEGIDRIASHDRVEQDAYL